METAAKTIQMRWKTFELRKWGALDFIKMILKRSKTSHNYYDIDVCSNIRNVLELEFVAKYISGKNLLPKDKKNLDDLLEQLCTNLIPSSLHPNDPKSLNNYDRINRAYYVLLIRTGPREKLRCVGIKIPYDRYYILENRWAIIEKNISISERRKSYISTIKRY
jgi:hypothetical protein